MNSAPFFSLLIPNCGNNPFLEQCLASAVKQKTNNLFTYEIIICDQNDEDLSNKIHTLINQKYRNIFFYHSNTKSLFLARHTLLDLAKGAYICFLDSDDYLDGSFLYSLYNSIVRNQYPEILVTSFRLCDENNIELEPEKNLINLENKDLKEQFFFTANVNTIWRKCFKKDLYDKNDYVLEDIKNGEDWIFSFPLILKAERLVYDLAVNGYRYRINTKSMTHHFSLETAEKQLGIRDNFFDSKLPFSKTQRLLVNHSHIKLFINVSSRLLRNHGISRKQFVSLAKEERKRIRKYGCFFAINFPKFSEFLVCLLLYLRFYTLIYWLFKCR